MTKKDLSQIKDIFLEVFEPFAMVIQNEFTKASGERGELKGDIKEIRGELTEIDTRLFHLENRAASIEDILTRHQKEILRNSEELLRQSKELQFIRIVLAKLQRQNKEKANQDEFVLLEQRVSTLEEQVAR